MRKFTKLQKIIKSLFFKPPPGLFNLFREYLNAKKEKKQFELRLDG